MKPPEKTSYISYSPSIGLPVSVVLDLIAFDNLAVGLGIGIALGFAVGAGLDASKRKQT